MYIVTASFISFIIYARFSFVKNEWLNKPRFYYTKKHFKGFGHYSNLHHISNFDNHGNKFYILNRNIKIDLQFLHLNQFREKSIDKYNELVI